MIYSERVEDEINEIVKIIKGLQLWNSLSTGKELMTCRHLKMKESGEIDNVVNTWEVKKKVREVINGSEVSKWLDGWIVVMRFHPMLLED